MKEDSLTASVARLYRAGSEHSQQTKKLREAVNNLLMWLNDNLPISGGFGLPCGCNLYPSGDFVRTEMTCCSPGSREVFRVTIGQEHSMSQLYQFSELIADGFLDKLSEQLESEALRFKQASGKISKFMVQK